MGSEAEVPSLAIELRAISLGAGVQSTTMSLMAAAGEITPMPDCAIFADTGAEPRAVYEHLAWLETQLPFPVHRVSAGNLRERIGRFRPSGRTQYLDIPAWTLGGDGREVGINRSCTATYKLEPIRKKIRELVGLTRRRSPAHAVVEQWIGISLDEVQRMKPAREKDGSPSKWIQNRWPLIDARMTRHDCLRWLERNGFPRAPRSACTFCPFRGREEWRSLAPDEFADAVVVDRLIRDIDSHQKGRKLFLHRSLKPLDEVDFSAKPSGDERQLDLFGNECSGVCGV